MLYKLRLLTNEQNFPLVNGEISLSSLPVVNRGKRETLHNWARSKGFHFRQVSPSYKGELFRYVMGFYHKKTRKGKMVNLILC